LLIYSGIESDRTAIPVCNLWAKGAFIFMSNETLITADGLEKLKKELKETRKKKT